jgi:hypothetical protein
LAVVVAGCSSDVFAVVAVRKFAAAHAAGIELAVTEVHCVTPEDLTHPR